MDSALIDQFSKQLATFTRTRTAPLILELDLTEGVIEARPPDPLAAFQTRHQLTVADVVAGLKLARDDNRVKALVTRVGGKPIGLAEVQEMRDAVRRFGEAGKPTVAWAETFGEFSPGNVPYYLATAFDTIYLQPSGELTLTGIAVERRFLRGTLDKLGVTLEVSARHEYKTAAEQLTERGFSAPAREAVEAMAESVIAQIATGIADRRAISLEDARKLINDGPFTADQAVEAGLVDALGYRDEVYAATRKMVSAPAPELLYLGRYTRARDMASRAKRLTMQPARSRAPAVALIQATGGIRRGRSGRSPMTGMAIGSDSMTAALRAATADPHIGAIVLRVNSPGGSYVASDAIWREVVRTRNAGKPLVASMSDVAASGGYYISMAADAIVAQPGTITGSIGVLTGKPVLSEMLDKAGITTDSVVKGDHAAMFSTAHPFTEAEWALIDSWLDRIYADFTGKVAAARGLSAERVHELARGRVWTGADAAERDLVDELGGLEDAAAIARRRAGLPPTAPLVPYPRISPFERLRPPANSEDRRAAARATAQGTAALLAQSVLAESMLAEAWGPLWRLAAGFGLPAQGPLMLPGTWSFE
jgi:protease IV